MKQSVIQSLMARVSFSIYRYESEIKVQKSYAQECYQKGEFDWAIEHRKNRQYNERKRNDLVQIQKELKAELKLLKKPKHSKKHSKGQAKPFTVTIN